MQTILLRIKFPPASNTEAWCMLDNIISTTLHKYLGNKDYNQWLNKNSQVIYNVCIRIYRVKEKNNKPLVKKSRCQRMMQDLRMKKRNLKKQISLANADEKEGLLKIWKDLKEKHNALSKAENMRKRRVKWTKEQDVFSRNHTNMWGTY